jgi:gamma-glutamyltranspeptidase/glutathione hydrolase
MTYGSRASAGLGFLLNNEMDDFASKPAEPNMFGLVQEEANAIQVGKRPLSTMMATIVLRDGTLFMVLGSPGGSVLNRPRRASRQWCRSQPGRIGRFQAG